MEGIWTADDKQIPTQPNFTDTESRREQWERYRKFKSEQSPQDTKTLVKHK